MTPMTPLLHSSYSPERMGFKFTLNIKIFTNVECSEADILRLIFPFDRQTNTLHVASAEVRVTLCVIFNFFQGASERTWDNKTLEYTLTEPFLPSIYSGLCNKICNSSSLSSLSIYPYISFHVTIIQCLPLVTEPGTSLIILPLMRILLQNLKRTTDTHYRHIPLHFSHCTNFVAISSLVSELLKKCRVR